MLEVMLISDSLVLFPETCRDSDFVQNCLKKQCKESLIVSQESYRTKGVRFNYFVFLCWFFQFTLGIPSNHFIKLDRN